MKYTKEEARRIVLNCAKKYNENLLGKNLIIIYRDRVTNDICDIEVIFNKENYQHLTGLELVDKSGNLIKNQSVNFYRKCIEKKLGINEFRFRADGTTQLKLSALPVLMDITKITKITGEYNNSRPYLIVHRVIGGTGFCLGLTKVNNFYVPSSALLENIKKLTNEPSQVLAILEKDTDQRVFSKIKHVAKGLNLKKLVLPNEIANKISLENYVFKGKESK